MRSANRIAEVVEAFAAVRETFEHIQRTLADAEPQE